jgi:hypothetical protein
VAGLPGRRGVAAAAIAGAALALLLARSWRIDYGYSIDFQTYWLAGSRLLHGRASDLYAAGGGPENGTPAVLAAGEFKNIPLVATVFVPFALLDYPVAKRAFWWLSLGALAATAWVLGRWVLPPAWGTTATRALGSFAALAAIAPTHIALRHGQTTPFVTLLLTVYLASSLARRPAAAGRVLALACLVKFPPLVLVPLDVARGRRRIAVQCVLALGGALFVSLAAFGSALHRDYAAGIASQAGSVMTGHNNQSLTAVAARLLENAPTNDWTPRPAGAGARAAALGVGIMLVLIVGFRLLRPRGGLDPDPYGPRLPLEFAAVLPLGVVLLPVAWDHYLLLAAPGLVATVAAISADRGAKRAALVAAAIGAYLLIGVPTPSRWLEAATTGDWRHALLVSHYFIGALAVSGLALAALQLRRGEPPPARMQP